MTDPRDYLAAYRKDATGSPRAQASNLAAVRRRIASGEVVDDEPAPREASAWNRRAAAFFAFSKPGLLSLGVATAAVGAVKVGASAYRSLATPMATVAATRVDDEPPLSGPRDPADAGRGRPARPDAASTPLDSGATASPDAAAPPDAARSDAARSDAARSDAARSDAVAPPPAGPRKPSTTPSHSIEDTLKKEVAMVERTKAELDAGDYAAVLRITRQLDRELPQGSLLEERHAWQTIAACKLGRPNAPALAERFARQHEQSPLVAKVRHSCAKESDGSTPSAG